MTVERYLMEALKTSPVYVEDVFSTYLYTGNGSTQTITNNIDLSTKGGMVWTKNRSSATYPAHCLFDTLRGAGNALFTNTTDAQQAGFTQSFLSTGFSLGGDNYTNQNSQTYASWTFRKQPKFFDVVTYTGNGVAGRQIAHSLGATPGMIIVKSTNVANNWAVWHKSLTDSSYFLLLNLTNAQASNNAYWNSTAPTSTVFTVGDKDATNQNGNSYVAYLFADSNSGGFGLSGSDSVVACGSWTGNGSTSGPIITLGWEPQFILYKRASSGYSGNWFILDNMRGMGVVGNTAYLIPNQSGPEYNYNMIAPLATGFQPIDNSAWINDNGATYIYMAIRRGPMKVPTSGTSVFNPTATSVSSGTIITTSVTADLSIIKYLDGNDPPRWNDRLRGYANAVGDGSPLIRSNSTAAEAPFATGAVAAVWNTGFTVTGTLGGLNSVYYSFRRAPGFFDIVCYTGTGVARDINHNLGVVPELYIIKQRSGGTAETGWPTGGTVYPNATDYYTPYINSDQASVQVANAWRTPTATTFGIGSAYPADSTWNYSGATYVAYLFATCPGVSKVGSYTGTGAAQNINCGFSAGARFVLIKRTDSTGDWYVYDSARGISSGNDPYLLLNSTAAQVTGTNYVDTFASGFTLTASAPAALNANGGSYIFLAVA